MNELILITEAQMEVISSVTPQKSSSKNKKQARVLR